MKKVRGERVTGLYGRKKKTIISVTCILGILCAVIIIVTFYGQNVGTFSIKLGDDLKNRSIFLSTDPEFNWYNSRLEADPLNDANLGNLPSILEKTCKRTNGTYISKNRDYISYTFYLKNLGIETVSVSQICRISGYEKTEECNISDLSWFWYFEDDEENGTVYKRDDKNGGADYWDEYPQYPQTTAFIEDDVVYNKNLIDLKPGDVKKITLITWIEAADPDMTDYIADQKIRYELSFAVYDEEQ